MKRLLSLLRSDTEIVLRPGNYLGEYIIRGVRIIDDSNKVQSEVCFNLDMLNRESVPEDKIWEAVRDQIWHGLNREELNFYKRILENEEGGDADGERRVNL